MLQQEKQRVSMAEESFAGDLPVKRPREDEENGALTATEAMETETNSSDYISSVIPGWFSEISPMWPGISLLQYPFIFLPPSLLLATKNTMNLKKVQDFYSSLFLWNTR